MVIIFIIIMKSRKIILVFFLVVAFAVGIASLQENYTFDENEYVATNEISTQPTTITVEIVDGIGSKDNG